MSNRDEPVHLVPHDDRWPARFAAEAAAIRATIGPWITGGVHHVGSTAVPGLPAKPVIDIQVGVAGLAESRPCLDLLRVRRPQTGTGRPTPARPGGVHRRQGRAGGPADRRRARLAGRRVPPGPLLTRRATGRGI